VRHYEEQRREVTGLATGRVLEIGVGLGLNFAFYPPKVTEVVGLDSSRAMLEKSRRRIGELKQNNKFLPEFILVEGSVTSLEFNDHEFDTVLSFLVFCSLDDPGRAVREVHRVLKPGGKLLFFEHVLAKDEKLRKWQMRLNPLWKRIACGCDLTRNTKKFFDGPGFHFEEIREYVHPKSLRVTSHKIQGIATKYNPPGLKPLSPPFTKV
jgi:ubiquinone/menaquinone biosynthesis C-methylase UbiE